ncbi:ABC transporter ATP-binding protein [Fulvivirga sp. RKSG066]|uniref:ABC-F family ATP-binding cassette domain-containing protein n=1 Tax=Fulvivirga aurantia TaxID=2529383 RepID=UPI0012BB6F48|nr:ABC-F family ATP-binding cassette domain-containing protein [Fulvivirga aurantia]MTI20315.1 ABC transporter ATP-binding protein [Fulvivirga aurantia]
MNYLSVDSISKSFNERVLFDDISFGIAQGEKVALVGVNGSGKSTLLKILAGIDVPDKGEVVINNEVKVTYLGQQPEFDGEDTVLDAILYSDDPIPKLIKDYEYHLARAESDPSSMEMLSDLIGKMDELDAWNFESQVKEILGKLGVHDLGQQVATLSGGQKKRVGLAKALIEKPDLVILDEPTNHLDLDIIEWLEEYLSMSDLALIMVTHDRYFLDKVTSKIIELDQQSLFHYEGDYANFLIKKEEREVNQAIEKEKARNLYKKELEWMRRQPKARGTKAKYRVDAFDGVKEKAHKNLSKSELDLDVTTRRQGGKILELENIEKSFGGEQVVHPFSYLFKKKERIGIVGKNGSGKSTFLNMITGALEPDHGKIVKGETTVFGYYKQKEPDFKPNQKVIDVVQEIAEVVTLSDGKAVSASRFLTQFKFAPKAQHNFVEKLSGGEKRRLQLLTVLIKNPNFLILDEPTNDLDLDSLRVLEDFLEHFQGCLIIVSHDRYFLDRLVDHLFVFEKNKPISDFVGNYTDFRLSLAEKPKEEKPKEKVIKEKAAKPKTQDKGKMSYNEKREFEQLEKEIEKLNQRQSEIEKLLNSGEEDHEKLINWGTELKEIKEAIDMKEMRWLELSELQS